MQVATEVPWWCCRVDINATGILPGTVSKPDGCWAARVLRQLASSSSRGGYLDHAWKQGPCDGLMQGTSAELHSPSRTIKSQTFGSITASHRGPRGIRRSALYMVFSAKRVTTVRETDHVRRGRCVHDLEWTVRRQRPSSQLISS